MKLKASVYTFGCRLNSAESALIIDRLRKLGCEVVEPEDAPDLMVVNSCAVTAEAVSKTRRYLNKLRREHPAMRIVVTGCAAQLQGKQTGNAADLIAGNGAKSDLGKLIAGLLQEPHPRLQCTVPPLAELPRNFKENAFGEFPFRSRAFIKIQEGCENFCSYCIVPHTRGPERSRDFAELLEDCRHAVAQGFPEIVLTGVNVCNYSDSGKTLEDVIAALDELPGDFRVRLSSTEPAPCNRSLIPAMAGSKRVCRFLHLALQSGSDSVLSRMNRHYKREEYARFAESARRQIPGLHLGSDVIAGFPGESEQEFLDGCDFIRKMQFANVHIFSYSKRPGTPAAEMPDQIPAEEIRRRHRHLQTIADESKRNFALSQCGKILPVIFEEKTSGNLLKGWSDNYLQIAVPAESAELDRITMVKTSQNNLMELKS